MSQANVQLQDILDSQAMVVAQLRAEYEASISSEMGQLYNQFIAFIAATKVPLPNVLVVLEILKRNTIEQAVTMYLGGQ